MICLCFMENCIWEQQFLDISFLCQASFWPNGSVLLQTSGAARSRGTSTTHALGWYRRLWAYRWFLTGPKKPHILWQRVWMRFALQIIGRIWTDLLSSPIEVDTRAQIFKSASPLVSGLRRLEMPMVPLSPSATASLTCTKAAAWVSETMRWLKEKRSGVQKKQLYTC